MPSPLRVFLGEYDCGWQDPQQSLDRIAGLVRGAKERGADLVVLPEMCTTGFSMDAAGFSEPLSGPSVRELARIGRRENIWLIAGLATRASTDDGERFYNSALLIDRQGILEAEYRKQRLFAFAREEETYTAGAGPVIVTIEGVSMALFICFDLRFPELFRVVAPKVDAMIVIANWPAVRRSHWDTLLRARAIESQSFVIGVNRTGEAAGLVYDGGSIAYDPWGEPVATIGDSSIALIDPEAVTSARRKFPLVSDQRQNASEG